MLLSHTYTYAHTNMNTNMQTCKHKQGHIHKEMIETVTHAHRRTCKDTQHTLAERERRGERRVREEKEAARKEM